MKAQPQITFRHIEPNPSLERNIRQRVRRLERYSDEIVGCRIAVEAPHRRHRKGGRFHVRIDLTVPGAELVVGRHPERSPAHEELPVALRDAFRAARRELMDWNRTRHGQVKRRETGQAEARVRWIRRGEGYGFLETRDGRDVYFHQHSVLGADFAELRPGTRVRYVEESGESGPQASTVVVR